MSRIGNRILEIPNGVNIEIKEAIINVKGPKGIEYVVYNQKQVDVKQENNTIIVKRKDENKTTKMIHGTINANLLNAIVGVTNEFKKELTLKGVGYKAKVEGKNLTLTLGFSHPVILAIPEGLRIETPTPAEISVIGTSKEKVGQFCAVIRTYRKPEPYKGKGVLFKGEQIIRKIGKKAEK